MAVYNNVTEDDLKVFLDGGYRTEKAKSRFETIRLKGKSTIILYRTGKMLIQGTTDGVEHANRIWKNKPKETQNTKKQLGNITGSDETLKGDTFGGLIVASVYAGKEEREFLTKLGVADSKKINDKDMAKLAKKIKEVCQYKIIKLTAKQYNQRRKAEKLTELLNNLHNEVYIKGTHVVDKYPGCEAGHECVAKAESQFVEVAAASILARDAALRQFESLSKKAGKILPKGSTHVEEGLKHIRSKKLNPENFVKLDFKNVKLFFKL